MTRLSEDVDLGSRTARARVPVPGSKLALTYSGDRVPGYEADQRATLQVTGSEVPDSAKRVKFEAEIAGQRITETFPPEPNLEHTVHWDGTDPYDRPIASGAWVDYRVGYVFDAIYRPPDDSGQSFGGQGAVSMDESGGDSDRIVRREETLWAEANGRQLGLRMSALDDRSRGLGGWGLDVRHQYDPAIKVVHRGDGGRRNVVETGQGGEEAPGPNAVVGIDPDRRLFGTEQSIAIGPKGAPLVAGDGQVRRHPRTGSASIHAGALDRTDSSLGNVAGVYPTSAHLTDLVGCAVDGDGTTYLAGPQNKVVAFEPGERIEIVAGTGNPGYSGDGGPATEARVDNPRRIAVTDDGTVFFGQDDTTGGGGDVVRRVTTDGTIDTVAGGGSETDPQYTGPATELSFQEVSGLAVSNDGTVYVSDAQRGAVRQFTPGGEVEPVAGSDGTFGFPRGLSLADDGTLYVADAGSHIVHAVGTGGDVTTVAGTGEGGYSGNGGPATAATFKRPIDVVSAPDGGFYVLDQRAACLRYVDTEGSIQWVSGKTESMWSVFEREADYDGVPTYSVSSGDGGPATRATFDATDVSVAEDGSIYFTHRGSTWGPFVRRVTPDGEVETIAGTGERGYSGDGGPATEARFAGLESVATGPDGSVYVLDIVNNVVRRIRPDGIVETVAGNGDREYGGDGGPATEASFFAPKNIAVDRDGNLYIAGGHRVRRVGTNGIIRTIAGGGEYPAEDADMGTQADIRPRGGLAVSRENVFFNHENQVFRVDSEGSMTRVAGISREPGTSGLGNQATNARLREVTGLAVGPDGQLYISEEPGGTGLGRVLVVTNDGILAGISIPQTVPPSQHAINMPHGIDVGTDGGLYVNDRGRGVIYKILGEDGGGPSIERIQVPSEDGAQVYEFNPNGRHLRTLDGLNGEVVWDFEYDDEFRLSAVTGPENKTTTIEREDDGDPVALVAHDGRRTELSTRDDGFLERIAPPAGNAIECAYDTDGSLTSVTDRAGDTTTFSYDSLGRVDERTDARDNSHVYRQERTDEEQRITHLFPNGDQRSISLSYGEDGVVVDVLPENINTVFRQETIRQSGQGTETETTLAQDERFDKRTTFAGTTNESWGGRSSTTEITKTTSGKWSTSGVDRLVRKETVDGTERRRTTYRDGDGIAVEVGKRSLSVNRSDTDSGGYVATASIPGIAPVEKVVDADGKVTSIRQAADGDTREMTARYDGPIDDPSAITLPTGETYEFERNGNGEPTALVLPGDRTVSYTRNGAGRIEELELPGGASHTFAWESEGLLSGYTPPGGGTVSYTYDSLGRVSEIDFPSGNTMTQSFDDRGRITSLSTPAGEFSYEYDPVGALDTVSGPNGQGVSFDYTGPLPNAQRFEGPVSGAIEFAYHDDGRLQELSVGGGESVTHSYDGGGPPTAVGNLELFRNSDHGLITRTTIDNATDEWGYNAFGDTDGHRMTVGGTTLYEASHTRDDSGRLTEMTETVEGTTTTWEYEYDEAGRLSEVRRNGPVVESFEYDERNNPTEMTDESGTVTLDYDDADRLDSAGDRSYSYDEDGRLTTIDGPDGDTSLSYTVRDTLSGVQLPNGTDIEYVLDPMGRRVGKRVDGSLERGWLYLDALRPVAELDGDGSVVAQFVYGSDTTVPEYMIRDGTRYRLVTDHRESVRLVVDTTTGEVAQRLDYDAFGQVTTDTNPGFQPFGFAGGLYDPDTGLVRFGNREYDPRVGRWTTRDPSGFRGSPLNLYAYVANDPINARDPTGLSISLTTILIIAGGATLAGLVDYGIQRTTGDGKVNWTQWTISTVLGGLTAGTEGVLYSTMQAGIWRYLGTLTANLGLGVVGQLVKNCVVASKRWYENLADTLTTGAFLNTLGPSGLSRGVKEVVPSGASIPGNETAQEAVEVVGDLSVSAMNSLTKFAWNSDGSANTGDGGVSAQTSSPPGN